MKHMIIETEMKVDGKVIGTLAANPKDFKTGSRGFYAQGKIELDGKRYQVQIQLVEIGSKKPAAETSQ
jgi:hypothetical protein